MGFASLNQNNIDKSVLKSEYAAAHKIGIASVGEKIFFFKKGFKVYYIPYTDIKRAFRRVYLVPAKMCCASGELQVEYLALWSEAGEIAQIALPGKKAAEILIKEMKEKAPEIDYYCPKKEEKTEDKPGD